jgi:hypothetical protein
MTLKFLGPVLYGLNVAGMYFFARKMLGWTMTVSVLAGAFFAVQLASLRISWDLLRNTLGMGILLFTLPLIRQLDSKRGLALFVVFSLLSVFAHEYSAVTLLALCIALGLKGLVQGRDRLSRRLILAVLPAFLVFVGGMYLRLFPVSYESPAVGPSVVWAKDVNPQAFGSFPFFVNYVGISTAVDFYPSYLFLVLSVLALFALLYFSYVYLVWKGFFRNRVLDIWTGLLLIGSFGCVISPFFALQYWHRWMFMLVYPFTFYAVNGAKVLLDRFPTDRLRSRKFGIVKNKVSVMILATIFLGAMYLATPVLMVRAGFGIHSLYPICVYFSSSPTVPYQDVDGTIQAVQWLEDNMQDGSCAVLQQAFVSWAGLYFQNSDYVVGYVNDVNLAVNLALQNGCQHVFFVCWNENVGWYGAYVPESFVELQKFGRISVFQYVK